MTIKKGVVEQNRIDNAEHNIVTRSKLVIVEKTQGSYTEYLVKRVFHSQLCDEQYMFDIRDNYFTVYHDITISDLLALLDITEYTWSTPLTEVA